MVVVLGMGQWVSQTTAPPPPGRTIEGLGMDDWYGERTSISATQKESHPLLLDSGIARSRTAASPTQWLTTTTNAVIETTPQQRRVASPRFEGGLVMDSSESMTTAADINNSWTSSSTAAWLVVNTTSKNANNNNDNGIIPRHEACFVQLGRKAYLMGGRFRQDNAVDIYDTISRTWSKGRPPPLELHHFQCVTVDDAIWIVAAWTGDYPRERTVRHTHVYTPAMDAWSTRTGLPRRRRRGSAAAIVVGRRIYVSHGNRGGHETTRWWHGHATSLNWLDYYDVDADAWTSDLPNAPNARDHAGGALVVNQQSNGNGAPMICVAGGRNGGQRGFFNKVVLPTDCFNLETETWSEQADIPQGRAGSSYGTSCDGKLIVAGGEGLDQAFDNVDMFDGSNWTSMPRLKIGRHGSGLAVDCACRQITVASGAATQGGDFEIASVETFFPSGVDAPCLLS